MESEDNNATPSPSAAEARRRSGRVVRAPQKFIEENHNDTSSKRKRTRDNDEDAENHEPNDSLEEASDEEVAEESDAELAPRQKKSKSRAKKPAAKKPKINGDAATEAAPAPAQALRLPNRPKKTVRVAIARKDGDGLYGEHLQRQTCFTREFVLTWWQPRFSAPATHRMMWPRIGSNVTSRTTLPP